MYRVINVEVLQDCRLYVGFEDGVKGKVDLLDCLFGSMFEPLKDPKLFAQVDIDGYGAVFWPNGADLAPDALYRQLADRHQDVNR